MSYGQSTLAWLVVVVWHTGSAALALRKHPSHRTVHPACPSYQAQALAPTFVYPFARCTAYTPPLLATSGHPFAQDQLDQAGQDRRDQLPLLASRPVVLPHTRPAHTCIVSSYGKCKRYSTTPGAGAQRFTEKVIIDIQHPLLGRRWTEERPSAPREWWGTV